MTTLSLASAAADSLAPAAEAGLLRVRDLKKHFPVRRRQGLFKRERLTLKAVDGIGFNVGRGETLGLVGESGCGKTTAGRVILGLIPATAGDVRLGDSPNLLELSSGQWKPYRRRLQMIFQDPYSSLDPRMSVGAIVGEALAIHGLARGHRRERVAELLEQVGLAADASGRYPHELSGGQRQRVGIARALSVEPDLIVADEPVSALDVSIQAQVINLLIDLRERLGLAYVFISHDLSVIGHVSHRVAVMYLGKIVEIGPREAIFNHPRHPYTQILLEAVPKMDPATGARKIRLEGDVPSPINPPPGCPFHPRCPLATEACKTTVPALTERGPGHLAACIVTESGGACALPSSGSGT
jgi:oligopeptide/dipeptide ABC transporter ATP-binding protein